MISITMSILETKDIKKPSILSRISKTNKGLLAGAAGAAGIIALLKSMKEPVLSSQVD